MKVAIVRDITTGREHRHRVASVSPLVTLDERDNRFRWLPAGVTKDSMWLRLVRVENEAGDEDGRRAGW